MISAPELVKCYAEESRLRAENARPATIFVILAACFAEGRTLVLEFVSYMIFPECKSVVRRIDVVCRFCDVVECVSRGNQR